MDSMLHVLRNPHGWCDEAVREARIAAANEIEALRRTVAEQKDLIEMLRKHLEIEKDSTNFCLKKLFEQKEQLAEARKDAESVKQELVKRCYLVLCNWPDLCDSFCFAWNSIDEAMQGDKP